MSDSSAPPPGFYDDPDQRGKLRWWDGSRWTDISQDDTADMGTSGGADESATIVDRVIDTVSDNLPNAQTAIGGALIADGVIGFGKNRVGIGGAIGKIIIGTGMAIIFAFVIAPWMSAQMNISNPVTTQAEVLSVEQFQSDNTDDKGNVTSTSLVCTVTLQYRTEGDGQIQVTTPYSSSSLCSRFVGEQVEIRYDAQAPGRFEGLDPMSDGFMRWFPWIFAAAGALIALSGVWTLMLRATQIGGGIFLIARSRKKDHDKVVIRQATKGAGR